MDSSDKKKTPRTKVDENVVATAVSEVLEGRLSIRKAAVKYNLKLTTLTSRVKKRKEVSGSSDKKKTSRTKVDENDVASAISDVLEGKLSMRRAADKYNLKLGTLKFRLKRKKAFLGTMEHSSNIDERAVASAISDVLEGRLTISRAAAKYNLKHGTLHYRIMKKKALLGIMGSSDKKKTPRTKDYENVVATAVLEVLEGRLSIRKAAIKYNLILTTLTSRVKKWKEVSDSPFVTRCGYCQKIFSKNHISTHIKNMHADVFCRCSQCKMGFENKDWLHRHIKRMHEEHTLQSMCSNFGKKSTESTHPTARKLNTVHASTSTQQQDVVVIKEEPINEELELGPIKLQHMDCNYRPYKEKPCQY